MKIDGVSLDDAGDMVCAAYKRDGQQFEPESMRAWLVALQMPGSVAVDVGAYTGLFTIRGAQQGAYVFAFEPHTLNFRRMIANIEANGVFDRVRFYNAACGSFEGLGVMYDLERRPLLTSAGKVARDSKGSVPIRMIDTLKLARCDAIKIDVEGAELEVLRGARNTIASYLPRLIIEANTQADEDALNVALACYGYRPGERIDERNLVYVHPDR